MRYIDTGGRDAAHAFGTWLQTVLNADVEEIRWQTGFFSADCLGLLQGTLRRLAQENRPVKALIGSNDQSSLRADVESLAELVGIPRQEANLGVVSYSQGYFHPKTFHVRRNNGTEAAYVGSANLTRSGVSSIHVEAGVTIDSEDGDSAEVLQEVAGAVDFWFDTNPAGLHRVTSVEDIQLLTQDGILGEARPPRPQLIPPAGGGAAPRQPSSRLQALMQLPVFQRAPVAVPAPAPAIVIPASPRAEFPPYILFAPGQETPTRGRNALSGASLPAGAAGLIVRLNRDSARHFEGRVGTANISIPVASLNSFRFGMYHGRYSRPRAEFTLAIRYIGVTQTIVLAADTTNIMVYGFIAGESGHGDVRMLVPGTVKNLATAITNAGRPLPQAGDLALLEWPSTNEESEFRLTFLDRDGPLSARAVDTFAHAMNVGASVGGGACWLPHTFSPEW